MIGEEVYSIKVIVLFLKYSLQIFYFTYTVSDHSPPLFL